MRIGNGNSGHIAPLNIRKAPALPESGATPSLPLSQRRQTASVLGGASIAGDGERLRIPRLQQRSQAPALAPADTPEQAAQELLRVLDRIGQSMGDALRESSPPPVPPKSPLRGMPADNASSVYSSPPPTPQGWRSTRPGFAERAAAAPNSASTPQAAPAGRPAAISAPFAIDRDAVRMPPDDAPRPKGKRLQKKNPPPAVAEKLRQAAEAAARAAPAEPFESPRKPPPIPVGRWQRIKNTLNKPIENRLHKPSPAEKAATAQRRAQERAQRMQPSREDGAGLLPDEAARAAPAIAQPPQNRWQRLQQALSKPIENKLRKPAPGTVAGRTAPAGETQTTAPLPSAPSPKLTAQPNSPGARPSPQLERAMPAEQAVPQPIASASTPEPAPQRTRPGPDEANASPASRRARTPDSPASPSSDRPASRASAPRPTEGPRTAEETEADERELRERLKAAALLRPTQSSWSLSDSEDDDAGAKRFVGRMTAPLQSTFRSVFQ